MSVEPRKKRTVSIRTFAIVISLVAILSISIGFALVTNNLSDKGTLNVVMAPKDVKLYPDQTQYFQVLIFNGTPPFTVKWFSNETYLGGNQTILFGFEKPAAYTILSVIVTDSLGNYGTDAGVVWDPAYPGAVGELWINPLVYAESYIVGQYNSTFYYAKNGTNGNFDYIGTDQTVLFSNPMGNLTAGGGSVYVEPGTYSTAVVVKNNTRLVLEKGVTGITYSADTGAYCLVNDYAAGFVRNYVAGTLMWEQDMSTGNLRTVSANFTDYVSMSNLWWNNVNRSDVIGYPMSSYSYALWTSGGTTYAKNGRTGQIETSGAVDTVLQYAENQLTAGGNIYLDHTVTAANVIINNSNVAIWSDVRMAADVYQGPSITNITLNAQGASVRSVAISGISTRELNFYHNGSNVVVDVLVQDCQIRPSAGSGNGIRFMGDGGVGYTQFVWFIDNHINDWLDQSSGSRWRGAISVEDTSTGGNGYIWFYNLQYTPYASNARMLAADGAGRLDRPISFSGLKYVDNSQTNASVVYLKNGKLSDISISDSYIMSWVNTTFLYIDNAGSALVCRMSFNDNTMHLVGTSSQTFVFINNTANSGNWSIASGLDGIWGQGNEINAPAASQTFTIGTKGNNANFFFDIGYIYTVGTTIYPYQNKQLLMGGVTTNLATDGSLQYMPLNYKASAGGSVQDRAILAQFPGLLLNTRIYLDAAPGVTGWRNFTLFVNGVASALTINMTGVGTSATEILTTVTFSAGDRLVWQTSSGGTPAASMCTIDIEMFWLENPT